MHKPKALIVTGQLLQDISFLEEKAFWRFINQHPEYLSLATGKDLAVLIGNFSLLEINAFWKYVVEKSWAGQVIDLFDRSKKTVEWKKIIDLLPGNYHETVVRPEVFVAALNLCRFLKTAEEASGKKIVAVEKGNLEVEIADFFPTAKGWPKFVKLKPKSRLKKLVRDAYAIHYFRLVKAIANRMSANFPKSVEVHDLYSSGLMGLVEAIDGFDPGRGNKFETFATFRIRGAIFDDLRENDWVPRSIRKGIRQVDHALVQLQHKFGRSPVVEEISRKTGLTPETVLRIHDDKSIVDMRSFFEEVAEEVGGQPFELIGCTPDPNATPPDEWLEREEMYEFLREGIREYLTLQEFTVINLYYFREKVLRKIGQTLRISESRVSQIHTKALSILRVACNERFGVPIIESDGNGGYRVRGKQNLPCLHRHRFRNQQLEIRSWPES